MNKEEPLAVKEAYQAMKKGASCEADYKEALDRLNGPETKGAKEYFLLMAGQAIVRLNERMAIFTDEIKGRIFAGFSQAGDCLVRTTKAKLLKQLDPESDIVLNPGTSIVRSPGDVMKLSELSG